MELSEFDWPEMRMTDVQVQRCPQWSGLREVEPVFNRDPWKDWCYQFRFCCEEDPGIDWKGAGFARCKPEEVGDVEQRLRQMTALTNERFRMYLGRVLQGDQAHDGRVLIELDSISEASADGPGYLCSFTYF